MTKKRELLFSVTKKDLKIEYFSGTGAGGQHRNKHRNCVRMCHVESGARTTGQSHKERLSNVAEAFGRLTEHPLFKIWQAEKIREIQTGETIEQKVDKMMSLRNLRIEYKEGKGGKWTQEATITSE